MKELDFNCEAQYAARFRQQFLDDENVEVPEVIWDMAEVYSHMVSHKDIVKFKTNKDPILKKKVEFIKKNIMKIDKDFEF